MSFFWRGTKTSLRLAWPLITPKNRLHFFIIFSTSPFALPSPFSPRLWTPITAHARPEMAFPHLAAASSQRRHGLHPSSLPSQPPLVSFFPPPFISLHSSSLFLLSFPLPSTSLLFLSFYYLFFSFTRLPPLASSPRQIVCLLCISF